MSKLPEGFHPTSEALKRREEAEKIQSLSGLFSYIDRLPADRYSATEKEVLKNHATALINDPHQPGAVSFPDGTVKPFPQELRDALIRIPNTLPKLLENFNDQETRELRFGELQELPFTAARSLGELIDLIKQRSGGLAKIPALLHLAKELNKASDTIEKIEQSELPYAEILKLPQSIRDTVLRIATDPGTDVLLSRGDKESKESGWSIATGAENITEKSMLPLLKVDGNNAGSRTEATLQSIYFSPKQERIKN